jgi:hypothetical protein
LLIVQAPADCTNVSSAAPSLAAIGPCASKDSTMVTIMHTSAAHPTIYIQGDPGSRVIENSHSTDVRA